MSPIALGTMYSATAASITTSYVGGTAKALAGTKQTDGRIVIVGDAGSVMGTIVVDAQVSYDDGATYQSVPYILGSTGVSDVGQAITVSAGATVRDVAICTSHGAAGLFRWAVKASAGAGSGTDAVTIVGTALDGDVL